MEKTIFTKASLSFTLPISCQICLCKVKEPLVCPNQHVFCTQCMQVWLEHNQHCPSCRVPITPDTPCKQIIGGPSPTNSSNDRFSTPALRKVRFEMMYKEYEEEITKLSEQVKILQEKNKSLEASLEECSKPAIQTTSVPNTKTSRPENVEHSKINALDTGANEQIPTLAKLTKNLDVATAMYKQVRSDMDHLKQVNTKLRDENAQLLRDNGRLKQNIISNSPKKYERFTAAATHNRLLQSEKQVKQLRKALERSDNYIEELEKQLEVKKDKEANGDDCHNIQAKNELTDCLVNDQIGVQQYPRCQDQIDDSSYLEKPSPVTPSSGFSRLSLNTVNDNNSQSTSRSGCNRQLNFDSGNRDTKSTENPSSTDFSNTTFGNLDYTLTDELSDCAKLMREAAHRLGTRKEPSLQFINGQSTREELSGFDDQNSVDHSYSVSSKGDYLFSQSLPSGSSFNHDEQPTETSNSKFCLSAGTEYSVSSKAFHINREKTTLSEIPKGDATSSTSGVSSSERKSFGMPQRVCIGDGNLKRKTGDGYKCGLSSPSKTTKSE